jgi:hypothetical protein
MPASGQIIIKNKGTKPATGLHVEYSGHLDEASAEQFKNTSCGDGKIDLSNGTVAIESTITLKWKDGQGKCPTWTSFKWTFAQASYEIDLGDPQKEVAVSKGEINTGRYGPEVY